MNGVPNKRSCFTAEYLFYLLPMLAGFYIGIVLIPMATHRWPARFLSWQAFCLLVLMMALLAVSARPLYRLRHPVLRQPPRPGGAMAGASLIAATGGAVALLLQSDRWVAGALLVAAALPPAVYSIAGRRRDETDRRFSI